MSSPLTAREAKEFLVARIVAEADRQGTPLDDVERKMLYFTETAWMPDDTWEASEAFDRDYDQDDYEQRISQFVISLKQRAKHDARRWNEACRVLSTEDHYLLILVDPLVLIRPPSHETNPPESLTRWKIKFMLGAIGAGLLITLILFLANAYLHVFPQ